MRKTIHYLAFCLLIPALLLSACSGGSKETAAPTTTAPTTSAPTEKPTETPVSTSEAASSSAAPTEKAAEESTTSPTEEPFMTNLRINKLTDEDMKNPLLPDGSPATVTLTTPCGELTGVQYPSYRLFKGVRYATAERWERAEEITAWEGTYDATAWGDASPQHYGIFKAYGDAVTAFYAAEAIANRTTGFSEDCLNLNIWTPNDAENCPVLIYIHGGSFINGANTDSSTDGEAYADRNVILVSINYRLGMLGQAIGDGYTGNYHITDMITAINWVSHNIAAFGGDPSRIMISGESAGAAAVQDLVMSPYLEEGLICGAIMMSGGGDLQPNNPTSQAAVERCWEAVKKTRKAETMQELLALTPAQIYAAWIPAYVSNPYIDGDILPYTASEALKNGTAKNIPLIIGVCSEDMTPYFFYTSAMKYAADSAAVGNAPVYLYFFSRQQPNADGKPCEFGAFHACDLYYFFGSLYRSYRPFTDTDYRISETMVDYVTNFLKNGDPNGAELPAWDPAVPGALKAMTFDEEGIFMSEVNLNDLQHQQATGALFPYRHSDK